MIVVAPHSFTKGTIHHAYSMMIMVLLRSMFLVSVVRCLLGHTVLAPFPEQRRCNGFASASFAIRIRISVSFRKRGFNQSVDPSISLSLALFPLRFPVSNGIMLDYADYSGNGISSSVYGFHVPMVKRMFSVPLREVKIGKK